MSAGEDTFSENYDWLKPGAAKITRENYHNLVDNIDEEVGKKANSDGGGTDSLVNYQSINSDLLRATHSLLGDSPTSGEATATIRTGGSGTDHAGYALALQNLDDTVSNGVGRANLEWISASGERMCVQVAHPSHAHWSMYMRDTPDWAGGVGSMAKIQDIGPGEAGAQDDEFGWRSDLGLWSHPYVRNIRYGGQIDNEFTIGFSAPESERVTLFFQKDGNNTWFHQARLGSDYRFYNSELGELVYSINESSNLVDWNQNEQRNTVWHNSSTNNRPDDAVEGQPYFDIDLGQPIWYDGTEWVDAMGDSV